MTCTSPVDLSSSRGTLLAPRSRQTAVLALPPRCRLSASLQHHPTPSPEASNAQHPTPKTWSVPPNAQQVVRATQRPISVDTQRPILNTQRPKIFFRFAVSSHIGSVGAPLRPRGVFRGWGAARGSRTLPFGGGGGEVGVGGEVGGGGEVEERCTSQGGAKPAARRATQRPFGSCTRGVTLPRDPTPKTQRPTPNAQTPNARP